MTDYSIKLKLNGDALENIDEVAKASGKANTSLKELKGQLRQVTNELLATEPGSEQFIKLTQQAGALKDQMKDVAESINANAGPAVESLGNNFQLLTGKLANLDFQGAAESLKAIGGNISNINFADFFKGIQSMGSALASVGKALLTNPIFLIASAIAAAVVYAEDLLALVDGVGEAEQKLLDNTKERARLSQESLNSISAQENVLKKMGLTEEQILKLKVAKSKAAISDLEAQVSSQRVIAIQQIETAKRNKEILTGIITFITAPLQAILFTVDQIAKVAGKELNLRGQLNDRVTTLLFDPKQIEADAAASIAEAEKTIDTLKNQQAGFELAIAGIRQRASDEAKAKRDRQLEEDIKAVERDKERRLKANEEISKIERKSAEDGLITIKKTELQKRAEVQATADTIKKIDEELRQARINNAASTADQLLSVAASLNDAFGKTAEKQFRANKAFSIAQALISTFQGVNQQLAVPQDQLTGQNFVKAGIILAAGLANVARIARTRFQGGLEVAPSPALPRPAPPGAGASSTPSTGFGAFDASLINNRPAQVTPAFVLASDVKSQGEARQKVEDRARL
ncbi:MAG: hypothetical protein ACK505_12500 [Flavobacteriales bacterium]